MFLLFTWNSCVKNELIFHLHKLNGFCIPVGIINCSGINYGWSFLLHLTMSVQQLLSIFRKTEYFFLGLLWGVCAWEHGPNWQVHEYILTSCCSWILNSCLTYREIYKKCLLAGENGHLPGPRVVYGLVFHGYPSHPLRIEKAACGDQPMGHPLASCYGWWDNLPFTNLNCPIRSKMGCGLEWRSIHSGLPPGNVYQQVKIC